MLFYAELNHLYSILKFVLAGPKLGTKHSITDRQKLRSSEN